jgi:hypothetical protein
VAGDESRSVMQPRKQQPLYYTELVEVLAPAAGDGYEEFLLRSECAAAEKGIRQSRLGGRPQLTDSDGSRLGKLDERHGEVLLPRRGVTRWECCYPPPIHPVHRHTDTGPHR